MPKLLKEETSLSASLLQEDIERNAENKVDDSRTSNPFQLPLVGTVSCWKLLAINAIVAIIGILVGVYAVPRALPKPKDGTITGKLSMHSVKNVFYIISDGTGPETVAAYRYYRDSSAGIDEKVKSTIFDSLLVGMQRTYSLNRDLDDGKNKYTYVTDSAAGATALNAGVKTLNGYVSVDENRNNVEKQT